MDRSVFYALAVLVFSLLHSAWAFDPPKKRLGVKELVTDVSGTERRVGVVDKITADEMVVVEVDERGGEPREHTVVPINVLRDGKVLPRVWGMYAYRWEDMKRGDKVELTVMEEPTEKQWYCLKICIERRPGAKLPKSQTPDEDLYFAARSVYNDIDNGNDVSDEEMDKVFPPRYEVDGKTGEKTRVKPGVVHSGYLEKLKTLRAKAKDLKATPPAKK